MQTTMRTNGSVTPKQAQIDLSDALCSCAGILTAQWRQLYFEGDLSMSVPPQLDSVMELFIVELGRSLRMLTDMPTSAWSRTGGVFRLSHSRGAAGLRREFALLRAILEQAAARAKTSLIQQRRLRVMLDVAQAQALVLMGQRLNPEEFHGATGSIAQFSGLVVEIV